MNRRGFLKALAFTSLAPFIPAIADAPALDKLPFADILSGKYPLFLSIGNDRGPVRALGRQPIHFENGSSKEIRFGEVTEACIVDRGFLENTDGSIAIPFDLTFARCVAVWPGDTINVCAAITLS